MLLYFHPGTKIKAIYVSNLTQIGWNLDEVKLDSSCIVKLEEFHQSHTTTNIMSH